MVKLSKSGSYVYTALKFTTMFCGVCLIITEILGLLSMIFYPPVFNSYLITLIFLNILIIPSIILTFITLLFCFFPLLFYFQQKVVPTDNMDYEVLLDNNQIILQYYWPVLYPSKNIKGMMNKYIDRKKIINKINITDIKSINIVMNNNIGNHGIFYYPGIKKKELIYLEMKNNIEFHDYKLEINIRKKYQDFSKVTNKIIIDIDNNYHNKFITYVKKRIE